MVIDAAPGSELAHWLQRGGVTAAIIRPDRTVLRAGRRLSGLCDAVPRFVLSGNSDSADGERR
ncbi:monooxygenase, FAD-binding domain protein [Mycobacterium kansasii]|uniref:Monooxygenase, FAD-binding domain protein n=1 Tax=Mycobacterium kansasii TaxID=1768 RepID=A0A1V3WYJ3_MYCKA|nr:monooxygenase, FAD-binding domain protein [Mycobacterium kansasii]